MSLEAKLWIDRTHIYRLRRKHHLSRFIKCFKQKYILQVHWIQFAARSGDGKGLKLEKLANIFKFRLGYQVIFYISGGMAGLSMIFYRSSTIALYLASKMFEVKISCLKQWFLKHSPLMNPRLLEDFEPSAVSIGNRTTFSYNSWIIGTCDFYSYKIAFA